MSIVDNLSKSDANSSNESSIRQINNVHETEDDKLAGAKDCDDILEETDENGHYHTIKDAYRIFGTIGGYQQDEQLDKTNVVNTTVQHKTNVVNTTVQPRFSPLRTMW